MAPLNKLATLAVWLACVTSGSAAPSSLTVTAGADVPNPSDKTMGRVLAGTTGTSTTSPLISCMSSSPNCDANRVEKCANKVNKCTKLCRPRKTKLSANCKEACCGGAPPSPPSLPGTFTSKVSLKAAVKAFNKKPAKAEKHGPIAGWDVSGITDMRDLFRGFEDFNADISNWNTSGVTDMSGMFLDAAAFNQPLSFDTSSVTDMYGMFYRATAFNQPLSGFDTSRVTDMAAMFEEAKAFNQPLSFDTSGVTDMNSMFYRATAFNQPLSGFDTSRVTDMRLMFYDASSLSNANKLLIRCAWADNVAFASAGYNSTWAPGGCD